MAQTCSSPPRPCDRHTSRRSVGSVHTAAEEARQPMSGDGQCMQRAVQHRPSPSAHDHVDCSLDRDILAPRERRFRGELDLLWISSYPLGHGRFPHSTVSTDSKPSFGILSSPCPRNPRFPSLSLPAIIL
ncbi:hypothetical protein BHE74_00037899 [Ensete ventricosum]|nr:hypothetical protein BHE74_00037899 [Ensete ventricosum]RZS24189.1 hypothetical protein BHM03_00057258 [Ensete ventricosum]